MKIAILIQAHKNPQQVARLCRALEHPDIDIYLHLDLKCDIEPFKAELPRQVELIQRRVSVLWGDFSQVTATLNGLGQIALNPTPYSYTLLISGQDYPLVSPQALLSQLEAGHGCEYINFRKVDFTLHRDIADRIRHYHFFFRNRKLTIATRRLIYAFSPFRRRYPMQDVYKGSQWWTLTGECVDYIMSFVAQNPKFVKFHRMSSCSDEIFFQNIIMHSPFAAKAENNNHRYIDWSEQNASPKTLLVEDYNKIIGSDAWFARKFDIDVDTKVLDMIDVHITSGLNL